jgi:hypothetical protein
MSFQSNLRIGGVSSPGAAKKRAADPSQYARVVHVILSINDPKCKDASMINGVFYRVPGKGADESTTDGLSFAYQGNTNMRMIPMEGEIIEVQSKPAAGEGAKPGTTTKYWTAIVPIWNHPHHNAAPDTKQSEWKNNLLAGKTEQATINPLQANPGDTIFEGRLGQSIRFGGYKGQQSGIIDDSNDGSPIAVISNGQIQTDNGSDLIQEDIDKDFNSIYLVSNHKVKLTPANTKRSSYNTVPPASNEFKGNQVIINGGRLYFNAKEESILLSAKQSIGLNGATVNLDATDYFCVDAKKIYLGAKARTGQVENAVLGMQLDNWLQSLISTLQVIAGAMKSATNGGGTVASLQAAGTALDTTLVSLKTQIQNIKSQKVYIE